MTYYISTTLICQISVSLWYQSNHELVLNLNGKCIHTQNTFTETVNLGTQWECSISDLNYKVKLTLCAKCDSTRRQCHCQRLQLNVSQLSCETFRFTNTRHHMSEGIPFNSFMFLSRNSPSRREKRSEADTEMRYFRGEGEKFIRVCSPSLLQNRRHEPHIYNWSASAPEIPWQGLGVVCVCVCAHLCVYSCASLIIETTQVRGCRGEGLSHTERGTETAFQPKALSLASPWPVKHSQQPQRLLAVWICMQFIDVRRRKIGLKYYVKALFMAVRTCVQNCFGNWECSSQSCKELQK